MKPDNLPKLIALAVGEYEIRQLFHDGLSRGVHEVEGAPVIGLDEFVFRRESG